MRDIGKMSDRVAKRAMSAEEEDDTPLKNVDEAVDTIIAALQTLDENLSQVETDNVPQKSAIDSAQDLLDTAVKPYFADVAKALDVFEE